MQNILTKLMDRKPEPVTRATTLSARLPAITLAELELQRIKECLEDHNGNRTHAARALGVSIRTLQRRLLEYEQLGKHLCDLGLARGRTRHRE